MESNLASASIAEDMTALPSPEYVQGILFTTTPGADTQALTAAALLTLARNRDQPEWIKGVAYSSHRIQYSNEMTLHRIGQVNSTDTMLSKGNF